MLFKVLIISSVKRLISIVILVLAVVTYKSVKLGPPNVHDVTYNAGIGILNICSPVEGFYLVIFEPPQCAIHKQPSSSIVIPSGRPSFSEKMITSLGL